VLKTTPRGLQFAAVLLTTLILAGPGNAIAAERHVRASGATAALGALEPLSDTALPLSVTLPETVSAGARLGVTVRTAPWAKVDVRLRYASGAQQRVVGAAGPGGGLHAPFAVPLDLGMEGPAVVQAHVSRGGHDTFWQGSIWVGLPAPPSVTVSPQALRLRAGYHARVLITTTPGATVRYTVSLVSGATVTSGTARADTAGHAFVSFTTPAAVNAPTTLWVSAAASTPYATATGSASLVLVPRLALRVAVTVGSASVNGGGAQTVVAHSAPFSQLGISIADGASTVVHRFGQTDAQGAYTFSLTAPPGGSHARVVWITVHALNGMDSGVGSVSFTVRPAPTPHDYVKALPGLAPGVPGNARFTMGKVIMVSLREQVLRAYDNGKIVLTTDVTTGRPELPTVQGVFYIYSKVTPFEFHSPWPKGSPFYYAPTKIQYWMPFFEGYGLHDAWWRSNYGPGSNTPQGNVTGSHGCVNIPLWATRWIWDWAPVGTTVVVY